MCTLLQITFLLCGVRWLDLAKPTWLGTFIPERSSFHCYFGHALRVLRSFSGLSHGSILLPHLEVPLRDIFRFTLHDIFSKYGWEKALVQDMNLGEIVLPLPLLTCCIHPCLCFHWVDDTRDLGREVAQAYMIWKRRKRAKSITYMINSIKHGQHRDQHKLWLA